MPIPGRVPLALLDALAAGLGLGYLARDHRDALISHGPVLSIAAVVGIAVIAVAYRGYRVLRRTNTRMEALIADELSRRTPSPRPRR
ncbi:hypothetical protein [Amycolatopsis rubida]|uniref:Uncharacterized protein n=1 Tax=Amycolatopsis rubida TaxID=112413 RepID=A0A1I5KG44_9PSEU|nr:hypothetical protein [Amycolatopsis rubida]SFO83581.1 hypothetical protein SAMN05421854_103159 [Amycolatopsis rubida]